MAVVEHPTASLPAEALLGRARQGDPEAFCALIGTSFDRLFRQAYSLCHDASTADDLVQQTLIEAWRCLPRYQNRCRLSTWLYAILLHRFHNLLRARRSRPIPLSWLNPNQAEGATRRHEQATTNLPPPDVSLLRQERCDAIRQAVLKLPRKHREIVLLRFMEEASLREIAAALGCSIGTVKSRLHHGLAKLRGSCLNLGLFSRDTLNR